MPLMFSVVIPAFNRASLLDRCLHHLDTQTYKNFEVIIVDDFSTEDLESVCQKYKNLNMRYHRFDTNCGGGTARNYGVSIAFGAYIAFLDSDDYWLNSYLENVVAAINTNKDTECLISNLRIKKESTIITSISGPSKYNLFSSILLDNKNIQTSAIILKREVALKIKFNPKLRKHQDLDLYISLDKSNTKIYFTGIHGVIWDISHESTSISRTIDPFQSVTWIKSVESFIDKKAYEVFCYKYILSRIKNIYMLIRYARILSINRGTCFLIKLLIMSLLIMLSSVLKRLISQWQKIFHIKTPS